MHHMHAFDTLAFAKKLKNAGYTEAQAEALAEAQGEVFREMLESALATKEDSSRLEGEIGGLRQELHSEIGGLQQELKAEIGGLRQELKAGIAGLQQEMELMSQRLTVRLGSMLVLAVGALAAMRFFAV